MALNDQPARRLRAVVMDFSLAIGVFLWLFVSMALTGCGGGGGGGGSGEPPSASLVVTPAPPVASPAVPAVGGCTIAYWGDSISALTGPKMKLVPTLHAVVGGTASAALAAFLQDPLTERFIIIEYGTNDANAGVDLTAPVLSMLAWAKARNRVVILTGIPHEVTGNLAVEANYSLWQSQQGVPYADWPGVAYAGPSDTMPDGVHPADDYQQRLADRLDATIEKLAPECNP